MLEPLTFATTNKDCTIQIWHALIADMVTKTIYTDSFMVVVDVGAVPPTEAWLEETTYLIDKSGHTTAIIAQTDAPTSGVSLQPVPFTPVNAQISLAASSTTSPNPTHTPPSQKSGPSSTIIAVASVGVIIGMVIMAATLYLLRRRGIRARLRAQSSPPSSGDSASNVSSTSQNSIEKSILESKAAQGFKSTKWAEEGLPSWEAFLKEVEREYERFDESKMSSSEGYGSRFGGSGKPENISELKERYDQLIANHHGGVPRVGPGSTDTGFRSPTMDFPLSSMQTDPKLGQVTDHNTGDMHPILVPQPTSILKRPARKELKFMDAVQRKLGTGNENRNTPTSIEMKAAVTKKSVKFGENEIREFGRTPLPSSAGSVFSRESWDE